MANSKDLVTTAKPKTSGAVYVAPIGTALPTDATSSLAETYKGLGYISEDGFTISTSTSSENIKEWGGEVVNSSQTEKSESAKIKLIESLNTEVLKFIYGESNVTVEGKNITVVATGEELPACVFVVDVILKNDAVKRIVIDGAKPKLNGDVAYKPNEALGYEVEIDCPKFHKEYITTK